MIIGIDAGGTYTRVALYTNEGKQIDKIVKNSIHPLQVGLTQCAEMIADFCSEISLKNNIDLRDIKVGIGLAGYGQDALLRKRIESEIDAKLKFKYYITNDVAIALLGALNGKDGIVIVAGTGSIGYAKKNNEFIRCGGFGYQIGDEGSAYWIAKEMLKVFAKQCDGRLQKSNLYDLIMNKCSLKSDYEIINYIKNHDNRESIAKLAVLLDEAVTVGDTNAEEIFKRAASELANMANTLLKNYIEDKVIMSYYGGVFKSKEKILKHLRNDLDDRIVLLEPEHEATYGAYLLVKNMNK